MIKNRKKAKKMKRKKSIKRVKQRNPMLNKNVDFKNIGKKARNCYKLFSADCENRNKSSSN